MKFRISFNPIMASCFTVLIAMFSHEARAQYNQRTAQKQESKVVMAIAYRPAILSPSFLKPTNNSLEKPSLNRLQAYQPYSLQAATQFYKDQKKPIDLSGFVSMGYSIITNNPFLIPSTIPQYLPDRLPNK